eukprot:gb/GFBE01061937.1/.p1 GENE.gb/GFBE01061937.1/~~gb/GFBE01061937.1/.p1  ORF type:complete len:397 (+),score=120.52 gb/GFBE01061937.1/:1-1191(+)
MACAGDRFEEKVAEDQLVKSGDFNNEFLCNICLHVVGFGPKLTKCSHIFCGDCLEQWFAQQPGNQTWAQRAKTGGAVPCPVCKTLLKKGDDVYPVEKDGSGESAFLWRMISSLTVRCGKSSTEGGCCAWQGSYGSYWDHVHGATCGKVQDQALEEDTSASEGLEALEEDNSVSEGVEENAAADMEAEAKLESPLMAASEVPTTISSQSLDSLHASEAEESDDQVESKLPAPSPSLGEDFHSLMQAWVQLKVEDYKHKQAQPASRPVEKAPSTAPMSVGAKEGKKEQRPGFAAPSHLWGAAAREVQADCKKQKKQPKTRDGNLQKQKTARPDSATMAAATTAYAAQVAQWQAMQQWQAVHAMQYQQQVAYQYQLAAHMATMRQPGYEQGLPASQLEL